VCAEDEDRRDPVTRRREVRIEVVWSRQGGIGGRQLGLDNQSEISGPVWMTVISVSSHQKAAEDLGEAGTLSSNWRHCRARRFVILILEELMDWLLSRASRLSSHTALEFNA
jgi:hypothetical protein